MNQESEFVKRFLLLAYAAEAEIIQFIKAQGSDTEVANLNKLLENWLSLQKRVKEILKEEENLHETINEKQIPQEFKPLIEQYLNDNSIKKTFPEGVDVVLVEIDKLVALQRIIDADYCNKLKQEWAGNISFENLLRICISSVCNKSEVKHLIHNTNHHVFSSPNSDFRFLGSYFKNLEIDDLDYSGGGVPVAAIISFVGYGVQPVSLYKVGKRYILNNGFHRVYTLRSLGIEYIPVLVKKIHDVRINFPNSFMGFPREYILGSPRPTLMKDFFEPGFIVPIQCKKRIKSIEVKVTGTSLEIPL